MVAVGSKSIPEKQSVSIGLSKNSEDKIENDLFSDIFSSQGEITDNIVSNKENKLINNTKIEPILIKDMEFKDNEVKIEVVKNFELKDENKNIIDDILKSDKNYISSALNLDETLPKTKVDIAEFETETPAEIKILSDDNEIRNDLGLISLGQHSTKIILEEDEDLLKETEQENTEEIKSLEIYHGQYLNSVISKSTANKDNLNDKKIKNSSNKSDQQADINNLKINISNDSTNDETVSVFKNELNSEKNISKNNDKINIHNERDYLSDIKIKKIDYSKVRKEEIIIKENILVDKINITKNNLNTNTENFFKSKYFNTSNIYSPQGKNNVTNSQNNLTNASLEISNFTQINNINSGNSNNQNGNQSQSNINNFQILNELKENLDMSDKRWASNFVSRLNKAHSSKISELEIVLTPKNLGKMKVKISIIDKTAVVKIKTDNAAASSLIQDEQDKLSEMLKEVGLELEDFSSEQSFQQNLHDNKDQNQNNHEETTKNHKPSDESDKENYIKDESILNIKV